MLEENATVGEKRKRIGWLAPLLIVLSLLGIVAARATAEQFDFAVANIITLICGFVFVVTVGVLFLRHGQIPLAYKIGVIFSPVLLMAVGLLFFKPIGVDSELIPRFKYRWSDAAAPVVVKSAASESEKQPEVKSVSPQVPHAYPGFLGADRRATVTYSFTDPATWSTETPELLWKRNIGAGWSAFSVVGEIAVTLEQKEEQEVLQAYELKTGKPLWSSRWDTMHATSLGGVGPRSTPTIADGMVFAQGANGRLVAAKLETGETVWEKDLLEVAGVQLGEAEAEVAWGRSSSPLVIDDKLIIPLGGAAPKLTTLICFEAATGKELWRSGSEQVSYASPTLVVLRGVPQIVSVNNDSVSSHRIDDGVVLWETSWPGASNGPANVSQPVAIDSERVLLSKAYGSGAKMLKVNKGADDQWTVETLWENPSVLKTKFTNIVVHEGYAYGLSDGILECVDMATGDRNWKSKRYRHGQIMLVGDQLLVVAEDGSVALGRANREKFVESYRFQAIEGMTWNNPALVGDLLLVRNGEQAACYRLPLKESESR